MANLQRVRRYQHELEDAEGRADQAESSLHLIRAKHRSSVVTGKTGASKVLHFTVHQIWSDWNTNEEYNSKRGGPNRSRASVY